MSSFASIDGPEPATCSTCRANWSPRFLLEDIGQARLRMHGFSCFCSDLGYVLISTCPHCELPLLTRENLLAFASLPC